MSVLASSGLGTGPIHVGFLHGFLGSGRNLRTLASRWLEKTPSLAATLVDLPGHGNSPSVSDDASLKSMGHQVLETLDTIDPDSMWTLVGHSLGGRVALAASSLPQSRIREVVLLDIAPGPILRTASQSQSVLDILKQAPLRVEKRQDMFDFLTGKGLSAPVAHWLMMNLTSDDTANYRWRIDAARLDALAKNINATDLWECVENRPSGLRVSCIRGEKSPYVSDADVSRFEKSGCRVWTLKEAGHDVHVDALDSLVEILVQHVNET